MGLRPLTERDEIKRARRKFESGMRRGARKVPLRVGWKGGGGGETEVYWHADEEIWSFFRSTWSAYGTDDPKTVRGQVMDVQIDPPASGFDRSFAGVFLRDDHGNVYIAHSGRMGGGRVGIWKGSFRKHYRGAKYQKVTWPDGQETEVVVIGRVDSPRLPAQVGQFVKEVARIKKLVAEDAPSTSRRRRNDSYQPEFRGKKAIYQPSGPVESTCDHGLVVDALRIAIRGRLGA